MEIKKWNKIGNGLIEVEFSDGTRSQYKIDDLDKETMAPQAFTAQVKELYNKDVGAGKDASRGGKR